jgi:PAS domain S-box-containing protein
VLETKHRPERRATSGHLRAILEGALDAVVVMDATGRITFWNARAEEVFGWTAAEAVGGDLAELIIPPDDREGYRASLAHFLSTGQGAPLGGLHEVTAVRKSGETFAAEMALTHVRQGEYHTFSAFLRDITGRAHAERERERLLQAAEHARDEAEAASRAKDEFLATLSHELRTPLTSIVGWVYFLRTRPYDPELLAKGLEVIDRNAVLQERLVSEILDMSRILNARLRLNMRPVWLAPLVARAVENLMSAARAKSVRVQLLLDPTAGPCQGDADRLQQVAWNLVSNAVKFTPAGGRVTVRLTMGGGHVELAVQDSGVGIAHAMLPHVFDLFRQGDASNTRSHGGLGLGLAFVRHLVDLHGGTVTAQSQGEGQGATFTVRLPCVPSVPGAAEPAAGLERDQDAVLPGAPFYLEGVRVVLADSSDDARDVLAAILEQHGAHVAGAGSVAEALAAVARTRPHVLVTDLDLPDGSGYALLARVHALPDEEGGRTPAAALSGYARTDDRVQTLLAGFALHLAKPVQPAELVAAVGSLAGKPRAS